MIRVIVKGTARLKTRKIDENSGTTLMTLLLCNLNYDDDEIMRSFKLNSRIRDL